MTGLAGTTTRAATLVGSLLVLGSCLLVSLSVGAGGSGLGSLTEWMSGRGLDAVTASRVDRTVLALAVGAAMAISGALLQAATRNPLADPTVLGLTGGASLAVVVGASLFGLRSASATFLLSLIGVGVAALLVSLATAAAPPHRQPMTTILTGAAVLAATSSGVSAVMVSDGATLDLLRHWQVGSVAGKSAAGALSLLPVLLVGVALAVVTVRGLNALAMGDEVARSLGHSPGRARTLALVGAAILCAAGTALAGPIAFVGLVIPHLARTLMGPGVGWTLITSMVLGPALVLAADTLGRIVMPPSEIQAGIMCALVGTPVLLLVVRRVIG